MRKNLMNLSLSVLMALSTLQSPSSFAKSNEAVAPSVLRKQVWRIIGWTTPMAENMENFNNGDPRLSLPATSHWIGAVYVQMARLRELIGDLDNELLHAFPESQRLLTINDRLEKLRNDYFDSDVCLRLAAVKSPRTPEDQKFLAELVERIRETAALYEELDEILGRLVKFKP